MPLQNGYSLGAHGWLNINDFSDTVDHEVRLYVNQSEEAHVYSFDWYYKIGSGPQSPLYHHTTTGHQGLQPVPVATIYVGFALQFTWHVNACPFTNGVPVDWTIDLLEASNLKKVYIKDGTDYKVAVPFVRDAGVWKPAEPFVMDNSEWKPMA